MNLRNFSFLLLLSLFPVLKSFSQASIAAAWMSGDNTHPQLGIYGIKGVPGISNKPGSRSNGANWIDADGNLWLMGGDGYSSNGSGTLNDLWNFNTSTLEWTWVSGDNTADQPGIYGTKWVGSILNKPRSRNGAANWIDAAGNLWLMGGIAAGNTLNDLWKFNTSTLEWTWVSGDNVTNQPGIYGTQGVPGTSNKPGSRSDAVSWIDASGNLLLMGGYTYTNQGISFFNDLWIFNPSTLEWTWLGGDNTPNQFGSYGVKGTGSSLNKPGGRSDAVGWRDASGNLWIWGGEGYSSNAVGRLNDLWKFNTSTLEWTWVSGDNVTNQPGIYGTQGVPGTSNKPGSRSDAVSWIDASGNLLLMGGFGRASNGIGYLNDLWKYSPSTGEWTWIFGDHTLNPQSVYGTKVVLSTSNKPGGRREPLHWIDLSGNLWLMGGLSFVGTGLFQLNDLWRICIEAKTFYRDADGDGFGDLSSTVVQDCSAPAGYVTNHTDCDDTNAAVYPGAAEICNGIDDNCNGQADEGITMTTFYLDADADGYGDPLSSIVSCTQPQGYVTNNTDCAPQDADRWRTATLYIDSDSDGYDAGTASICYGSTIPSGYRETTRGRDCNDANTSVNAGAVEVCGDEIDNDCDGQVDEGCNTTTPLITVDDKIVYESEGKALIAVRLSHIHNQDVKAHFKTIDGTAVSNGRNQDYKNRSGVVVIPAGSLVAYVDITIVMDKITEGSEYFTLQLDHPHYATILDGTSRVTIMDGVPPAMTRANSDVETTKESATSKLAVSISPNPSAGHFILVNKSSNVQSLSVRISDAVGRVIEVKRGVPANASITFGHQYGPGIYYAEIMQGSEKVVVQLVRK